MVSTATGAAAATATSPTNPYPHPSQLAQLQAASHQGTPLVIPQATSASAAAANAGGVTATQLPYGSFINPGKTSFSYNTPLLPDINARPACLNTGQPAGVWAGWGQ